MLKNNNKTEGDEPLRIITEAINKGRCGVVKINIETLPSIPRSLWSQLPKKVRDILEKEHGYNHYNPETDMMESDHF